MEALKVRSWRRPAAWGVTLIAAAALAACGGGGGGGDGGSSVHNNVFVAESYSQMIGAFENAHPQAGESITVNTISSSLPALSELRDLELDDARDILYVANGANLLAMDHATSAQGSTAMRTVFSAANGAATLALDRKNNLLYVGGNTQILVYDGLDSSSSEKAPSRTISVAMYPITDVAVDATHNILYVYGYDTTAHGYRIHVYDGAQTLDGTVTPSRSINLGTTAATFDSILPDETNDVLYVSANCAVGKITGASAANGTQTFAPFFAPGGSQGCRLSANWNAHRLYVLASDRLAILEEMGSTTAVGLVFNGVSFTGLAVRQ